MIRPADEHQAIQALINEKVRNHGWTDAAQYAMNILANSGKPFSADDLRDLLGDHEPEQPNAIGGLFMANSRAGWIKRYGGGASRHPRRHGGYRAVWIGNNPNNGVVAA